LIRKLTHKPRASEAFNVMVLVKRAYDEAFLNEKQLLISISRISSASGSLAEAIRRIHVQLEHDLGGQVLLFGQPDAEEEGTSIDSQADRFLSERPGLPCQLVYFVPLRASGKTLGTLTFILASASGHDVAALKRIVTFTGEQLGMRSERNRLLHTRSRLIKRTARIRKQLAIRKAVQRAEGILVATWGIDLSAASLWILRQAECTRRPILEIAMKVCDDHIAQKNQSVTKWGLPPGYLRSPARESVDSARSVTFAAGH
jgi:hypothetical protein